MADHHPALALPLEDDLVLALRQAGTAAGANTVTLAELSDALMRPPGAPLPPTTVRLNAATLRALERAVTLAHHRGASSVTRADLDAALREQLSAAGLDLNRLRFVRYRIHRLYPIKPCLRRYSTAPTAQGSE